MTRTDIVIATLVIHRGVPVDIGRATLPNRIRND